ncbi:hypothetical protein QTI24_28390 [Variovorax sp. J22P240]|uniref:hypothetical protein n=1 Tax=Variovorax sp. J22P240 TaxID=3053514 RepID=UPI0025767647|nr:hypothetical protein [Variovorax sp. J22P240]MDM0002552.1 hypothetical protein [Variovorax sp. J22P240]
MSRICGQAKQAGTGKLVNYEVEIEHGEGRAHYRARVLLVGGSWHEIDAALVSGPTQSDRTRRMLQRLLVQIDGLDIDRLHEEAAHPGGDWRSENAKGPRAR